MSRSVRIIDVTLRDAHQCLWATRMTTAMMKDIAPLLDRAGFEAIDLVGGAVFDVCVRYLREDPWERMRILSSWVKETPLIIHTRGQSLFTFEFFADDVVALSAERFAANGMRYHTPYDAVNDIRNLEVAIRSAKQVGLHTIGGLVFTHSPVHTDEFYAGKAKELIKLGVDGVYIKDASGLLRPDRALTLVPTIKQAIGDLPLQLHSHCLSGLAPYTALLAVDGGVEVVHTATSTMANGASHSPTELFVRNCRRRGYQIDLDLNPIEEAADRLAYLAKIADKPLAEIAQYDEFHFHHQMPGGMISNLKYQLSTVGLEERLEDILEEAGHVRADLGYPIVVSPFAQYIITQAVLNVMGHNQGKPRYETVPDEVRLYVRGGYGEVVGDIDPNLYDKIVRGAEPITERPGAHVPMALEKLRKTRGPFASDDDLLLAAYYADKEYSELKRAGPIRLDTDSIGATPLTTLIKQLASRPSIRAFSLSSNSA